MKALLRKLNGSKTLTLDKLRRPVEQSTSALEETLLLANKYWKQLNQIEGRDWPLILNVFDKRVRRVTGPLAAKRILIAVEVSSCFRCSTGRRQNNLQMSRLL